jgi:DNA-binding protein H-NS
VKLETLDSLADDDLRGIIARAETLLNQRDLERKEKALADATARLAEVGLTIKDLINGKGKKSSKGPVYHGGRSYQHPTNKALVWKGTGKKPGWLVALEGEGKSAVEVANA